MTIEAFSVGESVSFNRAIMFVVFTLILGQSAWAKSSPSKKSSTKVQSSKNAVASSAKAVVPSGKPSVLSTPLRKPATLDPNSAVEVRGQARTLSMMLVLKNGKDGINFIKVRKDYKPEIQ